MNDLHSWFFVYYFNGADSKQFNALVADILVGVAFEDVAKPDLEHRYTM